MRPICIILAVTLVGCGTSDPCAKDPVSCGDAGADAGGLGSCIGVCVAPVPSGWYAGGTDLLWIGAAGATAPTCPMYFGGYNPGFVDGPPTVKCPMCACSPSSASCSLPSQLSANSSVCPGGSGAQQFDAPATWDGTCNATNAVPSANSLTVTPPPNPGGSCNPEPAGSIDIQGSTPALACAELTGLGLGTCADATMLCTFPKFDGFLTCIFANGSNVGACPDGWPTRHLLYLNSQACGCQCSQPIGESCTATVTAYEDSACSNPLGSVTVSSDQPQGCVNVTAGAAFGSKSSTPPVYTAGTCTPAASPTSGPLTLCCLP